MSADPRDPLEIAFDAVIKGAGLGNGSPELRDTPRRTAQLWRREFLAGYSQSPEKILAISAQESSRPELVVVHGISFHGLCPHSLLPFQGRASVGFAPDKKVVGLERLARLVSCFTQRLTLQEAATREIADALLRHLGAKAAGCILKARHLCLGIPYDRHSENEVISSSFVGNPSEQLELRRLLSQNGTQPQGD